MSLFSPILYQFNSSFPLYNFYLYALLVGSVTIPQLFLYVCPQRNEQGRNQRMSCHRNRPTLGKTAGATNCNKETIAFYCL